MTALPEDTVVRALRDPQCLADFSPAAWDRLLQLARSADLLARIHARVSEAGLLDRMPAAPWAHFDAASRLAAAQHRQMRREVEHVREALAPLQLPVVLLKGAAYLMADLPAARGRLFSDVDILVPRARLGEVEASLMLKGWVTTHHSPYDQRYYL